MYVAIVMCNSIQGSSRLRAPLQESTGELHLSGPCPQIYCIRPSQLKRETLKLSCIAVEAIPGQELQHFGMFEESMFEEHMFACLRGHVRMFEALCATVSYFLMFVNMGDPIFVCSQCTFA